MKLEEKIAILQEKHLGEWLKTRHIVEEEVSNSQSTFCICGNLATGLHESCCRKFNSKITHITVERLRKLWEV